MSMDGRRNSVGSGSTAPLTSLMWPGMMGLLLRMLLSLLEREGFFRRVSNERERLSTYSESMKTVLLSLEGAFILLAPQRSHGFLFCPKLQRHPMGTGHRPGQCILPDEKKNGDMATSTSTPRIHSAQRQKRTELWPLLQASAVGTGNCLCDNRRCRCHLNS